MLSINCKGKLLLLDEPKVMGIINTTSDSFFAGSRISIPDLVVKRAETLLQEGASIIDIGGQSTRPGSKRVAAEKERQRVLPVIEAVNKAFPEAIISIDTFYSKVAYDAVQAGASIINDVSAGTIDKELWPIVAALQVPYVLMHMQGNPQTMQHNPVYNNVVLEVFDFLNLKIRELQQLGLKDIIIDPGFGFGKTIQHNFTLLSQLNYFGQLSRPLLVGISRKGTIYNTLQITAEEALNGTTVLHTISLLNGASLLRVHDVKEAVEAIRLVKAYQNT